MFHIFACHFQTATGLNLMNYIQLTYMYIHVIITLAQSTCKLFFHKPTTKILIDHALVLQVCFHNCDMPTLIADRLSHEQHVHVLVQVCLCILSTVIHVTLLDCTCEVICLNHTIVHHSSKAFILKWMLISMHVEQGNSFLPQCTN